MLVVGALLRRLSYLRTQITMSAPEKVKTKRLQEAPVFSNNLFSRKKIIKDYVYTPEYRVIGV